jgi:hypothetical protein
VRCFLMKNGHIGTVEFLAKGPDAALIEQAKAHFKRRFAERFDGFEVWDGARCVYCYPEVEETESGPRS